MKTKTETFESALKKLEETVEKLEEGTIPLNEALTTFESGVHWSMEIIRENGVLIGLLQTVIL